LATSDLTEAVEHAALEDLHAAADDQLRARLAIAGPTIGGAFASIAGNLPGSAIVLNRVIGLGLEKPEADGTVADITAAYADAGVARYFVQLHPHAEPDSLATQMRAAGLREKRAWMKFERGRASPPPKRTDLTIAPARAGDGEDFGRIIADAFDLGEQAGPWLARLIGRPNWHIFMSFAEDGTAAGTGCLFVKDGIGWCDWGATAPAYRGRGGQSALLATRIEAALDLGCTLLGTETGEAVPGDPQHSYRNIERAGFKPTLLRANYAPGE
jgi:GNAT superfamily N-acetyltransferase